MRRAEEEWAGLQGPGGEGRDEARRLERVLVVVLVLKSGGDCGEIGGHQAERVVLCSEME